MKGYTSCVRDPSRTLTARLLLFVFLTGWVTWASAGNQAVERLSDAVRSALSSSIADRSAPRPRFDTALEHATWLEAMSEGLPTLWKPTRLQRIEFLDTLRYEALRAGLDVNLVLGLIEVESGFRRYAISAVGARGYMQVMPFWTREIGDGDPARLFDLRMNLRYGCLILRHYLDIESGNLVRALGRYNGSLGQLDYPNRVMAAWRRWSQRDPMPKLDPWNGRGASQVSQAAPSPGS